MSPEAKALLKTMPYLRNNPEADIQEGPGGVPYNAAIPIHNRKMQVVIPTHQRPERQITLKSLSLAPDTLARVLVITSMESDAKAIRKNYKEYLQSPKEQVISIEQYAGDSAAKVNSIATKRQWMIENLGATSIFQMDDDMYFFARCPVKYRQLIMPGPQWILKDKEVVYRKMPVKLLGVNNLVPGMLDEAFDMLQDCLTRKENRFVHVGLSSRMGNNQEDREWKETARLMHAIGHRRDVLLKNGWRFDELLLREDFNVTLRLLTNGYNNISYYTVCCSPSDYGAKGGCFDERTLEKNNSQAEKLGALYPAFVKVVDKIYEFSGNRKEVQVAWAKAYAFGLSKKVDSAKKSLF